MSPAQRRYLFVEQGVGGAVVNLLINAGIAALLFRGHPIVPLWGQQSVAGDTIGTTFLLPLLTCLIVTPLARREVRDGHIAAIEWTSESHPMLGWLPGGTVQRGVVLGVICTVIVAPLVVSALSALHVTAMSFWRFLTFKAVFGALLGAAMAPITALWAITGACPEGDAGGKAAPHRAE